MFYSSYRDAVGIDGGAIGFEWKNFQGFSSLSILRDIQQDLEKKNIQPEDFKDQIIFMSMFNDIEWKMNDENCISNAENQELRDEVLARTLDVSGSRVGREMVWAILAIKSDNGIAQPATWYSDPKQLVILYSRVPVLLPFTSIEILCIQNSCSKQFILSISSVFTEQLRIGVINSVWQKKKNTSWYSCGE